MAVQKNFIIKNGLEVDSNLLVADSSTDHVGVGTSSPKYTFEVIGGIGATFANILGIGTVVQEFNVGTGGTVITSLETGLTGFGTATPAYIVDIRSPVSTGQTALYVQGDVRVTGDLYAYDISLDQATFNNLEVTGIGTIATGIITTLSGANLSYSGIGSFGSINADTGRINTGIVTNLVTTGIASVNTGVLTSAYVTTGIVTTISGTTLNYTGIGTISDFHATDVQVSGLTTTGSLAVSTGFDVYADDSTFHGSVTIDGNLSIGGTSAILNAVQVRVEDKDIVLGFTTAITPSDDTANHGGIAIASTEGYPLISMSASGINTLPDTYKQIMWLKRNTMGAGTTDAFLFNYAVGVGSTQVPNGVRFAAGSIQFTDNVINTTNLDVTGVGTITTAVVDTAYANTGIITTLSGSNLSYTGIVTAGSIAIGATTVINSGRELQNIVSLDATTTATIEAAIANAPNTFQDISVTGIASINTGVFTSLYSPTGIITTLSGSNLSYSGIGTITTASIDTGYITSGVVTTLSGTTLNYSGLSTVGNFSITPVGSGATVGNSGIVTYYGDGSYLTGNARNLTATIGVGTTGGVAGYGVSFIQFAGPGVSTVYYDGNTGIATVTITGSNVSFAPGSAISPSMYVVGDQQTGFFSPGLGQFTVVSTGASVLNVNAGGINVTGIVTTSRLSVSDGATFAGIVTATDFNSLSDIRYKENITTVENALSKVNNLRGVKFNWKEDGRVSYGVIAQELEEVLPELVSNSDPKTVNYNGIIGVLIEAVKELSIRIDELESKNK